MSGPLTVRQVGWSPDFKVDNEAFRQATEQFLKEKSGRNNQSILLEGFSAGWLARRAPDPRLAALVEALQEAIGLIRFWHGLEQWEEYQQSPKMQRINAALEAARKEGEP